MSKTISVRVEPVSGRKAGGQRRHDLRDPAHIPSYVDRDRTADNSILIDPPDPATVRADIEAGRKAAGQQRLRADARTVVRGVITFGAEAQPTITALTREQQDALYHRIAASISKETGHQLSGLVVHRDESAPHAHFALRGYRRDEQGREQPWRHGREMMQRLQDVAAQEVAHLGIERGTPKAQRLARGDDLSQVIHRSVRELHRDLPAEREARQRELEELERERQELEAKTEKNSRLIAEQEAKLAAGRVSEEQASKRIATYQKRMQAAQKDLEALQERIRDADARAQQAEQREREALGTVDVPPPPPPPPPQTVEVVVGRGVLGRVQTQPMDVVPAAQAQAFAERWTHRDRAMERAMGKALARADSAEQAATLEKTKTRALGRVLEAIRQSAVAQAVARTVPLFGEWMEARQRQQQRGHGHGHGL